MENQKWGGQRKKKKFRPETGTSGEDSGSDSADRHTNETLKNQIKML